MDSLVFLDMQDRKVDVTAFDGQIVMMAGGARAATQGSKEWGEALEREYRAANDVRLFRLAIIDNLPRFVPRSLVKGQLGKDSPFAPMLVDWDHSANRLLDPAPNELPHVWVFDRQGHLRLRLIADPSNEKLRTLADQVNRLRKIK